MLCLKMNQRIYLFMIKLVNFFMICQNILMFLLFILRKKSDLDTVNNYNLSVTNVKCIAINKSGNKIYSYIKAYLHLFFLLFKVDYFYLFYPNSFKYSALFCVLLRKPFGLYVRGQKGFNSKFSKFLFSKSSFINTVSPFFSKQISNFNSNVFTIKPMINYDCSDIFKNRGYFYNNVFNLLFVGRIEEDKGVFELIDALIKLKNESHFLFKARFVGSGKSKDKLEKLVINNNLSENIEFLGSVSDPELLKKLYLKSDILVLPTYHEGFPRVLYESMIFGVAIITSFVGGIPFLMKNNKNCLKIDVKSSDSIFCNVIKLCSDISLISYLTTNSYADITLYLSKNSKTHLELLLHSLGGNDVE